MDSVKPWQIGVLALAVIVLGASLYWSFKGDGNPDFATKLSYADVKTGDRYEISIAGKGFGMAPQLNPDTAEYTLMPIEEDENGNWVIKDRYFANLVQAMRPGPDNPNPIEAPAVDMSTRIVKLSDAPVRTISKSDIQDALERVPAGG
ncbi:MAG: hypothetical protein ACF8SC_05020 [Phycisphaerales bacterium JB037]